MKVLSNNPLRWWRNVSAHPSMAVTRAVGVRLVQRLWPHDCFVCGARSGALAVCARCKRDLPYHDLPSCPICALPSPAGETCGQCLVRTPHFDASFAAFAYESPAREMVLAMKFGPVFAVCDVLGHSMVRALGEISGKDDAGPPDCIIPMPLHRRRISQRGFNQSIELARRIGKAMDLPVEPYFVERDIDTPQQVRQTLKQRRKNLRGAFRCVTSLEGLHVLVVDDVMTTGATLDELARTLKLAGARRVTNLVAARTLRERS